MLKRAKQFAQAEVRSIGAYNELSGFDALPRILIITFFNFPDVEIDDTPTTLAGQGVRTGIHSILVVNRTHEKSLPNNIKNNILARVVIRLSPSGESKAIGVRGAEKLEQREVFYIPNFGTQLKTENDIYSRSQRKTACRRSKI